MTTLTGWPEAEAAIPVLARSGLGVTPAVAAGTEPLSTVLAEAVGATGFRSLPTS